MPSGHDKDLARTDPVGRWTLWKFAAAVVAIAALGLWWIWPA